MLLLIFLTLYATVTLLQLAKLNRRFGSWSILQIVSCIVMLTFVPVVWYTTYIYPLGCEHYFNIIAYNLPTWCALWGRKFPLPTHQKWVPDFSGEIMATGGEGWLQLSCVVSLTQSMMLCTLPLQLLVSGILWFYLRDW